MVGGDGHEWKRFKNEMSPCGTRDGGKKGANAKIRSSWSKRSKSRSPGSDIRSEGSDMGTMALKRRQNDL